VIELAKYFLERHRAFRPLSLSAAAMGALLAYDWPGNVRELEQVIEPAIALAGGPFLELDDLPPALLGGYTDILLPALQPRSTTRAWGSRYPRLVLNVRRVENWDSYPTEGRERRGPGGILRKHHQS